MKYYSNELYHHGVKGQKWGIRRYQNPDGSLTPEGRNRKNRLYSKVDKEFDRKTKKARKIVSNSTREDYINGSARYRKKIDMALNKIDMETKLSDLRKSEIDKGFDYFENKINKTITGSAIAAGPFGALGAAVVTSALSRDTEEVANRNKIAENYKTINADIKNEYKNRKRSERNQRMDELNQIALKDREDKIRNGTASGLEKLNQRIYDKAQADRLEKINNPRYEYENGYDKESKQRLMKQAKNEDTFDLYFLESIQNTKIAYDNDKPKILKEYQKYLDNPDKYVTEEEPKLKHV